MKDDLNDRHCGVAPAHGLPGGRVHPVTAATRLPPCCDGRNCGSEAGGHRTTTAGPAWARHSGLAGGGARPAVHRLGLGSRVPASAPEAKTPSRTSATPGSTCCAHPDAGQYEPAHDSAFLLLGGRCLGAVHHRFSAVHPLRQQPSEQERCEGDPFHIPSGGPLSAARGPLLAVGGGDQPGGGGDTHRAVDEVLTEFGANLVQ
jgi:hypothetical protein